MQQYAECAVSINSSIIILYSQSYQTRVPMPGCPQPWGEADIATLAAKTPLDNTEISHYHSLIDKKKYAF